MVNGRDGTDAPVRRELLILTVVRTLSCLELSDAFAAPGTPQLAAVQPRNVKNRGSLIRLSKTELPPVGSPPVEPIQGNLDQHWSSI
jgi:hypothetical protein